MSYTQTKLPLIRCGGITLRGSGDCPRKSAARYTAKKVREKQWPGLTKQQALIASNTIVVQKTFILQEPLCCGSSQPRAHHHRGTSLDHWWTLRSQGHGVQVIGHSHTCSAAHLQANARCCAASQVGLLTPAQAATHVPPTPAGSPTWVDAEHVPRAIGPQVACRYAVRWAGALRVRQVVVGMMQQSGAQLRICRAWHHKCIQYCMHSSHGAVYSAFLATIHHMCTPAPTSGACGRRRNAWSGAWCCLPTGPSRGCTGQWRPCTGRKEVTSRYCTASNAGTASCKQTVKERRGAHPVGEQASLNAHSGGCKRV